MAGYSNERTIRMGMLVALHVRAVKRSSTDAKAKRANRAPTVLVCQTVNTMAKQYATMNGIRVK